MFGRTLSSPLNMSTTCHVKCLVQVKVPAAGYSQRINATTQITEFLKF